MTRSMTVRLDSLEHDPKAIEGHEHRLTQIDDLLASIPVKGQLQSLRVRAWSGKKKAGVDPKRLAAGQSVGKTTPEWGVIAGNRRLATLRALLKDKAEVQGVKVTAEFKVHVIVGQENDADAYEASVAENVQRLPPTPVEEFRAFEKMVKTSTVKDVAAHFGVPVKRVEQRLKLAALHPDVLDAVDRKKITMEAAQAFTIEPDTRKQADYLKKNLNNSWHLGADAIKRAFTDKLVRGDSATAKLIGKKAYTAAGGKILGDAFDDKASWWISKDAIDKCLEAHWAGQVKGWLEDGWLFVEPVAQFTSHSGQSHNWTRLKEVVSDYPAKVKKDAEALKTRLAEIQVQYPEFDDNAEYNPNAPEAPDAIRTEYSEKLARLEEIDRGLPRAFTAEQKRVSGVVYWSDGSGQPMFGVVKKGARLPKGLDGAPEVKAPEPTLDDPGREVGDQLVEAFNSAVARRVAEDPQLALRLLLATLGCGDWSVPLDVRREFNLSDDDEDGENDPSFIDALAATDGKSVDELLSVLAVLLARGVSINASRVDSRAQATAFIQLARPKPEFDAAGYFAKLSKPLLGLAWRDMIGSDAAGAIPVLVTADGKREGMAATAAAEAKRVGWLPPQLRTPSYSGPHNLTVPAQQLQAAE